MFVQWQGLFAIIMALGSIRAARHFHANLFTGLLRLPMSFFDAQPTGRLMNRFTKDTQAVDLTLVQVHLTSHVLQLITVSMVLADINMLLLSGSSICVAVPTYH